MTLDPMMKQLLDASREAGMPPDFAVIGAAAAKQVASATAAYLGTGPAMAQTEELTIEGPAGPIHARLYVPVEFPDGLIVFYHGGGWVIGTLDGYDPLARRLAAASGFALLLVDYRMAPDHPFPAPVDDCYTALIWADRNLDRLCGGTKPLVVAGDSAGGNLAAVVALKARDEGGPVINLQVLIYPVTDCDFKTSSYRRFADGYLLTSKAMQWFWSQYVPNPAARVNPLISPLRAERLAGLPPAMVELAGYDCLLDEGAAYASRLEAEGVHTVTRCWSGLCHGFIQFAMVLPPAGEAADIIGADIKARWLPSV